MIVREHRGSLKESLETSKTIEDMEDLPRVINESFKPWGKQFSLSDIEVNDYGYDDRTGCQTFIVTLAGYGVFGFVDRNSSDTKKKKEEDEQFPDINKCPTCGGYADNGFDRCVPPNPYLCTKCDGNEECPQE